jgi:hypothetical protein
MVKIPPAKGRATKDVDAVLSDHLGGDLSSIAVVSNCGSPAKFTAVD